MVQPLCWLYSYVLKKYNITLRIKKVLEKYKTVVFLNFRKLQFRRTFSKLSAKSTNQIVPPDASCAETHKNVMGTRVSLLVVPWDIRSHQVVKNHWETVTNGRDSVSSFDPSGLEQDYLGRGPRIYDDTIITYRRQASPRCDQTRAASRSRFTGRC